jgi:hypothetical protein
MLKLQQPPPPENYSAEICESALAAQRKAWERNITSSISNKLVLEQITILSALSSSSTPVAFYRNHRR